MNLELLQELTEAIKKRDGSQRALNELIVKYKVELTAAKKQYSTDLSRIAELEQELLSPGSSRPLLAAAERAAAAEARGAGRPPEEDEPETADERQRGFTAVTRLPEVPRGAMTLQDDEPKTESQKRAERRARQRARQTETADRREKIEGPKTSSAETKPAAPETLDSDYEPTRTYLIKVPAGDGILANGSEILGRVAAVDPGRAVIKAAKRWGKRQEYRTQELTAEQLLEDLKVRPKGPVGDLPHFEIKIDPMAAAEKPKAEPKLTAANQIPVPPDREQEYRDRLAQRDTEAGPSKDDPDGLPEYRKNAIKADLVAFIGIYKPDMKWQIRVCDGCNRPRVPTVQKCVVCGSAEYRLVGDVLKELGADPKDIPQKPKEVSGKPGPLNQDDALLRACGLLPHLMACRGGPVMDNDIDKQLRDWPTHRVSGSQNGNAWATVGGSEPRFYYDTDAADNWNKPGPIGQRATLKGPELIQAVRRVLHIRKPRASKADKQPVRRQAVPQ